MQSKITKLTEKLALSKYDHNQEKKKLINKNDPEMAKRIEFIIKDFKTL